MKEEKNIDRLFQEKFKDFEAAPSDAVWQNILAAQQKKKSRVIPLWWRVAGVAALIAVLFGLANMLFTNQDPQQVTPALVDQDMPVKTDLIDTSDVVNTQVVIGNDQEKEESKANQSKSNNSLPNPKVTSAKNNTAIVTTVDKNATNNNASAKNTPIEKVDANTQNAVAQNQNVGGQETFGESQNNKNNALQNVDQTTNTAVAENEKQQEKEKEKTLPELVDELNKEREAVAENEPEEKAKRWGIAPNLAPVYYGSFGGNGIAAEFNENSNQGDVNLSYGVQVSYAVNDKLTIRSGVNKVDLSYRTGNVAFTPGFSAHAISSIDYKKDNSIEVVNARSSEALLNMASIGTFSEVGQTSTISGGVIGQRVGYLEVPLELQYAVLDKKIGINVIGGVSTLFLNNNEIKLIDGDQSSLLGESNSLNNTSFSTNVGLGLDYKMTENIKLNLEPIFKYQLNAYKNSVSDFKPYYMGLYTGVSIKF